MWDFTSPVAQVFPLVYWVPFITVVSTLLYGITPASGTNRAERPLSLQVSGGTEWLWIDCASNSDNNLSVRGKLDDKRINPAGHASCSPNSVEFLYTFPILFCWVHSQLGATNHVFWKACHEQNKLMVNPRSNVCQLEYRFTFSCLYLNSECSVEEREISFLPAHSWHFIYLRSCSTSTTPPRAPTEAVRYRYKARRHTKAFIPLPKWPATGMMNSIPNATQTQVQIPALSFTSLMTYEKKQWCCLSEGVGEKATESWWEVAKRLEHARPGAFQAINSCSHWVLTLACSIYFVLDKKQESLLSFLIKGIVELIV